MIGYSGGKTSPRGRLAAVEPCEPVPNQTPRDGFQCQAGLLGSISATTRT